MSTPSIFPDRFPVREFSAVKNRVEFVQYRSARLRRHAILLAVTICFCTGCQSGPRYPGLCDVYENVVEGEIVNDFGTELRPSIYGRFSIPGRDYDKIMYQHRGAGLLLRYVDKCDAPIKLVEGDTITVHSQLDQYSEVWKTQSGATRRTTLNDVPILDLKVGQVGVFLLKYFKGEWHVVGHDKEKLYTQRPYVTEDSATHKLLKSGKESE